VKSLFKVFQSTVLALNFQQDDYKFATLSLQKAANGPSAQSVFATLHFGK